MIVRNLTREDMLQGAVDALLVKRLRTIPPVAEMTLESLRAYLYATAFNGIAVAIVAQREDGPLAGIFLATPASLLGAPVPVMADLLIVASEPGAMEAMAREMENQALEHGCKSMMFTCETPNTETARRWGRRFGARVVATTLFKEV